MFRDFLQEKPNFPFTNSILSKSIEGVVKKFENRKNGYDSLFKANKNEIFANGLDFSFKGDKTKSMSPEMKALLIGNFFNYKYMEYKD